MSASAGIEAKLVVNIGDTGTHLNLYTINLSTDKRASGTGTVVTSRVPGFPISDRSPAFGFEAPSDSEVIVTNGGAWRTHETIVRRNVNNGNVTIDRIRNGKPHSTSVFHPLANVARIEHGSDTNGISSDLIPLLAIGAVAASAKLFPRLRIKRKLINSGLVTKR